MNEIKVNIQDVLKNHARQQIEQDLGNSMGDGGSCSESEPFALQVIDDSMEPEFATGCIVIIDPTGVVKDGAFVFAKDLNDEYIFRQLRIIDEQYYLAPLNDVYETLKIPGIENIEGIITQRAGKKRTYHKWYDR